MSPPLLGPRLFAVEYWKFIDFTHLETWKCKEMATKGLMLGNYKCISGERQVGLPLSAAGFLETIASSCESTHFTVLSHRWELHNVSTHWFCRHSAPSSLHELPLRPSSGSAVSVEFRLGVKRFLRLKDGKRKTGDRDVFGNSGSAKE